MVWSVARIGSPSLEECQASAERNALGGTMSKNIKRGIAAIIGVVIGIVLNTTLHIGILPMHDPEHLTGVYIGTPQHAIVTGYTPSRGFLFSSAALEQ